MTSQQTPQNKKAFFKNDRALVCSMLTFYGICILGLLGAAIWWLGDRSQKLSMNSTATANAASTAKVEMTATAVARATEHAGYMVIDSFDDHRYDWRRGTEYPWDNGYWLGYISIKDGVYFWKVREVEKTFISRADFSENEKIRDFDVYVDVKMLEAAPGDVCSGLIFRDSSDVDEDNGGYYYYGLCNNSWAKVSYHSEKDGWETISRLPYLDYTRDWNRLEITARDTHFVFRINGMQIFEMDDDRQNVGELGLVVELNEKVPATIQFDNFGYQPH